MERVCHGSCTNLVGSAAHEMWALIRYGNLNRTLVGGFQDRALGYKKLSRLLQHRITEAEIFGPVQRSR